MKKPYAKLGKNVAYIDKDDVNVKILKWIVDKKDGELVIQGLACTYLYERGTLAVLNDESKLMNLDELIIWFSKNDPFFISKYIVFKDLADKGYLIREPIGEKDYDIPILIVSEGITNKKRYMVYVIEEGYSINVDKIYDFISKKIGEDEVEERLILAIVERRGGVTYYTAEIFLGANV